MGVYSKMLGDEIILKNVAGVNKLVIITCPGCACESLSYNKGLPNRVLKEISGIENAAIAVHIERDRLARLFVELGIVVDTHTSTFPCELTEPECVRIAEKAHGTDAVCVLACSGGFIGVRNVLPRYEGKIIPLMRSTGAFVFRIITAEGGAYSVVEQESAKIIPAKAVKE
jgi:hypothetical protein